MPIGIARIVFAVAVSFALGGCDAMMSIELRRASDGKKTSCFEIYDGAPDPFGLRQARVLRSLQPCIDRAKADGFVVEDTNPKELKSRL